jgi:hypothetical protein
MHNTKIARNGYQCKNQNCAQWILVHGTKVVCTSYFRDKEVMHNGYKCVENDLPCDVVDHVEYCFTGLNLCA